jgi:hypothetical protein
VCASKVETYLIHIVQGFCEGMFLKAAAGFLIDAVGNGCVLRGCEKPFIIVFSAFISTLHRGMTWSADYGCRFTVLPPSQRKSD